MVQTVAAAISGSAAIYAIFALPAEKLRLTWPLGQFLYRTRGWKAAPADTSGLNRPDRIFRKIVFLFVLCWRVAKDLRQGAVVTLPTHAAENIAL